MPNKPHAIKKMRVDEKRNERNRARLSRMRTFVKKVEEQVASGNHKGAMAALQLAESELHRTAQYGLIKAGNAARHISRLNKRIKTLVKKSA